MVMTERRMQTARQRPPLLALWIVVVMLSSACAALPRSLPPSISQPADPSPGGQALPSPGPADAPTPTSPSTITIRLTGDLMMDSFIGDYIESYGVDYPWSEVAPLLREADLSIINLETSVSTRGATKKPAGYGFRSLPYTMAGLVNSGIDAAWVANNHILDYGVDAFTDTLNTLKEHDIVWVGAGQNRQEAEQLKIMERNGIKVGLLAFTEIIPYPEWVAEADRPGVAPLTPSNHDRILQIIRAADDECDVLLVSLHWGTEYVQHPHDWQVTLAHQMVEQGADGIIGHHPHVLQGIEFYQGKPILYSLGNFVFLKMNELCGKTGIFELTYDKEGFQQGRVFPVWCNFCKAYLQQPTDPVGREVIEILRDVSRNFSVAISDHGEFGIPGDD